MYPRRHPDRLQSGSDRVAPEGVPKAWRGARTASPSSPRTAASGSCTSTLRTLSSSRRSRRLAGASVGHVWGRATACPRPGTRLAAPYCGSSLFVGRKPRRGQTMCSSWELSYTAQTCCRRRVHKVLRDWVYVFSHRGGFRRPTLSSRWEKSNDDVCWLVSRDSARAPTIGTKLAATSTRYWRFRPSLD